MVRIRKSVNEEASILWNIQKQAFLPLYEKYHDKDPCKYVVDIGKAISMMIS